MQQRRLPTRATRSGPLRLCRHAASGTHGGLSPSQASTPQSGGAQPAGARQRAPSPRRLESPGRRPRSPCQALQRAPAPCARQKAAPLAPRVQACARRPGAQRPAQPCRSSRPRGPRWRHSHQALGRWPPPQRGRAAAAQARPPGRRTGRPRCWALGARARPATAASPLGAPRCACARPGRRWQQAAAFLSGRRAGRRECSPALFMRDRSRCVAARACTSLQAPQPQPQSGRSS